MVITYMTANRLRNNILGGVAGFPGIIAPARR
jgi:hypothetical protein